jgi:hypothetical protein
MDESTPRPTISVENLTVGARAWPKCKDVAIYDRGGRFCFRLGKFDGYWQWPWPEWIGLPTRDTLLEWFDILEEWKAFEMKPDRRKSVDDKIRSLITYI